MKKLYGDYAYRYEGVEVLVMLLNFFFLHLCTLNFKSCASRIIF